jgi:hypothetical protein
MAIPAYTYIQEYNTRMQLMRRPFIAVSIVMSVLLLTHCASYAEPEAGFVGFGTNNWHGGTPDYYNTSLIIDD